MKKRIIVMIALVIVLTLSLFAFTACNPSTEKGVNLISNGDFSTYDSSTYTFEGWTPSYTSGAKVGQGFHSSADSESTSDGYLVLDNGTTKLYNYLSQTVKVDVNRIYKVTVEFSIENTLTHDEGAFVSFLENTEYKFVAHRTRTEDESGVFSFVSSTFYVRPKNTDYMTIALCLGSPEAGCSGKVCFDNVSMERVDKGDVPEGEKVYDFRKAKTVHGSTNDGGIALVVILSIATAAMFICVYILLRRMYAKKNVFGNFGVIGTPVEGTRPAVKWYQNTAFIACVIALGAFLLRLIMLLTTYGMGSLATDTVKLADTLAKKDGVVNYFANNPNSSLAPGVMYILATLGAMTAKTSYATASVVFRLVNVLADVAVVLMIFFYGKKRVGNKLATVFSAMYAALPFAFVLTGMDNGFEGLLLALMLASLILMVEKQYLATYFVMALATVLDIRALALAPIIIAYFVYMYIKDDASLKKFTSKRAQIVFGLVGAFLLVYILTLPVAVKQIGSGRPFYNLTVLANELTNVNYFVNNAFTLYGMAAMNNKLVPTSVAVLNLIFILVLECYVISLYFKNRNRQELILLASFTLAVISVCTVKVDYTYLYLSIALGIIYTMVSGEKRMYGIMGGYSLLGILNFGQLVSQSGFVKSDSSAANLIGYETTSPYYIVFCVFALLLTIYYVYVTYSITNNSKLVDINGLGEPVGKSIKRWFESLKARFKKSAE